MKIKFQVNPRKALEAVLWLAHKQPGLTFHTVVKVLYYADKKHLNKYGRPVVGDGYHALEFGPVGSFAYRLLRGEPYALEALALRERPFEIRDRYHVHPKERKPDLLVFSPSDLEALEDAYRENANLSFKALTDKSHREPAWREADVNGPMAFEDMLEGDAANDEAKADLAEVGLQLVL